MRTICKHTVNHNHTTISTTTSKVETVRAGRRFTLNESSRFVANIAYIGIGLRFHGWILRDNIVCFFQHGIVAVVDAVQVNPFPRGCTKHSSCFRIVSTHTT